MESRLDGNAGAWYYAKSLRRAVQERRRLCRPPPLRRQHRPPNQLRSSATESCPDDHDGCAGPGARPTFCSQEHGYAGGRSVRGGCFRESQLPDRYSRVGQSAFEDLSFCRWPAHEYVAIVGGVDHDRVFGDAKVVQRLENLPDLSVVFDHTVEILADAALAQHGWPHMRDCVHAGRVEPAKERTVGLRLTPDKVDGSARGLIVNRLHALLGQRAGVFDGLFADAPEARIDGWIVTVSGSALEHAAWPKTLPEAWVLRISGFSGSSSALR